MTVVLTFSLDSDTVATKDPYVPRLLQDVWVGSEQK